MIGPDKVSAEIIKRLKKNSALIGIKDAVEIYEDFSDSLRAPYITVHSDFEEEADFTASGGMPVSIPVEIKATVFSAAKKTPGQTFEQAVGIAIKTLRLLCGQYTVNRQPVRVMARKKPLEIWAKKSDQSIIMINLYYLETVL